KLLYVKHNNINDSYSDISNNDIKSIDSYKHSSKYNKHITTNNTNMNNNINNTVANEIFTSKYSYIGYPFILKYKECNTLKDIRMKYKITNRFINQYDMDIDDNILLDNIDTILYIII
ncbi:hypothetical protein SLOPH_1102, partial [Spraguea lophii 42_110]